MPAIDSLDGNPDLLNDRNLIGRIRMGEPEAFDRLVQAHLSRLFRLARHITGSADAAEDVVQNVFMRMWMRRTTLDIDSDIRWYLWSAVRNEARQYLRGQEVRERFATNTKASVAWLSSSTSNPAPDVIAAEELAKRVLTLLEDLPPRCRDIFLLYWKDEVTEEEIASLYDISIRTVQNQVARAVRYLAKGILSGENGT